MVFPIPTVRILLRTYTFGKLFHILSICKSESLTQRKFIVNLEDKKVTVPAQNLSIIKCDESQPDLR